MNTHFETPKRFSATGVATAAMLIVMLAMAASTVLSPQASDATGGVGARNVAHMHHVAQAKAS